LEYREKPWLSFLEYFEHLKLHAEASVSMRPIRCRDFMVERAGRRVMRNLSLREQATRLEARSLPTSHRLRRPAMSRHHLGSIISEASRRLPGEMTM
jgi:hypothetical protein